MKILKYQQWHFLLLVLLLASMCFYVELDTVVLSGEFLGISSSSWFLFAILSPIIHQIYVLVCWRFELFYKSISKTFGSNGFKIYKIGFAFLILSRLVTIIVLAISSSNTLNFDSNFAYVLGIVLFLPPC